MRETNPAKLLWSITAFVCRSALDNRPLRFNEFEKKINQVVFVSATPAEFEIERSLRKKTQICGKSKRTEAEQSIIDARPNLNQMDPPSIVEQIIRPTGLIDPTIEIKPIKNQVDDLIERIKERISKTSTSFVATLTKRMAEELTEYLKEDNIKVQYVHSDVDTFERLEIFRDLGLGIYDVLVGINLLREGLDLPKFPWSRFWMRTKKAFCAAKHFLCK